MNHTRGDQKVHSPICYGEIYWIKMFASRPFDPKVKGIGSVKSLRSCLVAYAKHFLREEGVTHLQNRETLNQSGYQVLL